MSDSFDNAPVARTYKDALPKLEIMPNTQIYLRINPGQNVRPIQGEFLGMSHYEFLVLRLPSVPGLLNRLIPKSVVEIRYLREGAVTIFSAEIISHSVKPVLFLFTTYPDRLTVQETRHHLRVPCALPAILNTQHGDVSGVLSDISMGGCRITIRVSVTNAGLKNLAVNDHVVLQTVLSADGMPLGGEAVIRSIDIQQGHKVNIGMAFKDIHKDFASSLKSYLELVSILA